MSKHKKVVVTVDWKKLLPIIICIGISLAIVLVVTLI